MSPEHSGQERGRPSAYDIYERVLDDAQAELARPAGGLAFSGLFAGLTIGLSGLATAAAFAAIAPGGAGRDFAAFALYPIGFVAVVLGRASSSPRTRCIRCPLAHRPLVPAQDGAAVGHRVHRQHHRHGALHGHRDEDRRALGRDRQGAVAPGRRGTPSSRKRCGRRWPEGRVAGVPSAGGPGCR